MFIRPYWIYNLESKLSYITYSDSIRWKILITLLKEEKNRASVKRRLRFISNTCEETNFSATQRKKKNAPSNFREERYFTSKRWKNIFRKKGTQYRETEKFHIFKMWVKKFQFSSWIVLFPEALIACNIDDTFLFFTASFQINFDQFNTLNL